MPGQNHSRDFKLKVVSQINAGLHTTAQLCREPHRRGGRAARLARTATGVDWIRLEVIPDARCPLAAA